MGDSDMIPVEPELTGTPSVEKPEAIQAVPRSNTGVCHKCGETGCEKHLVACFSGALDQMKAFEGSLTPAQREKLRQLTEALDKIEADPALLKEIAEGKAGDVMINTGIEEKWTKVGPSSEETEESEEFVEETLPAEELPLIEAPEEEPAPVPAVWELPPPTPSGTSGAKTSQKPGMQFSGGEIFYSDYPDEIKEGEERSSWVKLIGREKIKSVTGSPIRVAIYRPGNAPARMKPALAMATDLVPALKRRMILALEAAAMTSKAREKKSGKIDSSRAAQLVVNNKTDVFYKKTDSRKLNTAVTILLDDSSSMRGSTEASVMKVGKYADPNQLLRSKNGVSMVMALALGEVCDQLDISFEVMAYQAGSEFEGGRYALMFKTFNEDWKAVLDRIGNYQCTAGYDYPYEGCGLALTRLASRKEERRVLFFLSDANAGNEGIESCYDLAQLAQRRTGIKMVGIGICTEFMKNYMKDRAETVKDVGSLNESVFGRLAKVIHPH